MSQSEEDFGPLQAAEIEDLFHEISRRHPMGIVLLAVTQNKTRPASDAYILYSNNWWNAWGLCQWAVERFKADAHGQRDFP